MIPSGCDVVGNRDFFNKGVREEASGKNSGVCSREANIKTLYMRREDGGLR